MRILHLEDDLGDSLLIERTLQEHGMTPSIVRAASAEEFFRQIETGAFDAVLIDSGVPGFDGLNAIRISKRHSPGTPVIVCSGSGANDDIAAAMDEGASDYIEKDQLWRLVAALHRAQGARRPHGTERLSQQHAAMSRLVGVVQELSFARELKAVTAIVKRAARELTSADGAAFVLREADACRYVGESGLSSQSKGLSFALSQCICGWCILNARPIAVENVSADERFTNAADRPTAARSLAMAPIRSTAPMGAIGVYWAAPHACTADELMLLEALANTTAVSLENVQVYAELENRVRSRTRELEVANEELEAFTYAVSHDLRAPLRALSGELSLLAEDLGASDAHLIGRIGAARMHVARMYGLIDDLLRLSGITRRELKIERFDLSRLAVDVVAELRETQPERDAHVYIQENIHVEADRGLMTVLLQNLLSNAWKYSARQEPARIELRARTDAVGRWVYEIQDNGAGFDPRYARRLFQPFQRLHPPDEFRGTGVGLATVQRIVRRHRGEVWGHSDGPGRGATFSFTLAS